jgi:hypothetical protein
MKNTIWRTAVLIAVTFAAGAFLNANAQSLSGSIGNGTVTRGTAARATVALSIPGGLHVNSNRPSGEYAIPTTVRATAHGAKIGAVSYPRGRDRKFGFSEHTINVYEGRAAFGFNVTVPSGYHGATITVRVAVHYQACTNEVCYAPKTKNITLTAKVR